MCVRHAWGLQRQMGRQEVGPEEEEIPVTHMVMQRAPAQGGVVKHMWQCIMGNHVLFQQAIKIPSLPEHQRLNISDE